jgi:hypothetical protein
MKSFSVGVRLNGISLSFVSICSNGPFARPWSKTMVGYGPEDKNFVLELAFNYGITDYKIGNDVRFLIIESDQAIENVKSKNWPITEDGVILSPQGYPFKLIPGENKVVGLALNVKKLSNAVDYYTQVLRMSELKSVNTKSSVVSYSATGQDVFLELHEVGTAVDHAVANGRLAISLPTAEMDVVEEKVARYKDLVHTSRVRLETPGKATVEVTILQDRDSYEICIVGAEAFFELCKPIPGGDFIDFDQRKSNGSKE